MRILDLFSGSGSIKKYFKEKENVEVISLDFCKKYKPDILVDIMEWGYKEYPIGYFDIIIAGPECKIFSNLQYTWIGRKWRDQEHLQEEQKKNSIFINKTIEIIEYFNPKYYFIENPLHSKIWNYVENENYLNDFIIVDYCAFGFNYKKPTKFLTNLKKKNKRCVCTGTPKHPMRLGVNSKQFLKERPNIQMPDSTRLLERYSYPTKLLDYLFNDLF
jgi:site-specific DNA-cytosine methylase